MVSTHDRLYAFAAELTVRRSLDPSSSTLAALCFLLGWFLPGVRFTKSLEAYRTLPNTRMLACIGRTFCHKLGYVQMKERPLGLLVVQSFESTSCSPQVASIRRRQVGAGQLVVWQP